MSSARVTAGCLALGLLMAGNAYSAVEPVSWLLEQVRVGEATHNEALISNSLYSLSLVEPHHPDLLAARARQALRLGKPGDARQALAQLANVAPDSSQYRQVMAALALDAPALRQQLQQARVLASAGRLQDAQGEYRKLFGAGGPPTLDLAVEYALLEARIPATRKAAIATLRDLEARYPGHAALRVGLVSNLLQDGRQQEATALLKRMALHPGSRDAAASLWLDAIREMPVGTASMDALRQFIVTFGADSGVDEALALLDTQEQQWASPAFRQRQQVLARSQTGKASIGEIKAALAANPDVQALRGALAEAYSRGNRRAEAVAQLEQLLRQPDVAGRAKWESLLATNRYWLLLERADKAADTRQWDEAVSLYQQATRLEPQEAEGWLGLGDTELARQQDKEAERAYRKVLSFAPGNERALGRLFDLYVKQDPAKALALVKESHSPRLQAHAARLKAKQLEEEADMLALAGKWPQAVARRQEALRLQPDDVWLAYRLAGDLTHVDGAAAGEQLLRQRLAATPRDLSLRYATALFLSGQGNLAQARTLLAAEPAARWTEDMRELDRRLARRELVARATQLREQGDEAAAERLLQPLLPDVDIALLLAQWATLRGEMTQADHLYQGVLAGHPQHPDARLGMAELALARGDRQSVRRWLPIWPDSVPSADNVNLYRQVANLNQQLGESALAQEIFATYTPLVAGLPPSRESALFWRDAARQRFASGDNEGALALDRKALLAGGVTSREDVSDEVLSEQASSQRDEGWLVSSLRSDLARHYRQDQTTFSFDSDYWGSSGTPGVSNLSALTQMLQLDTPLVGGTFFSRLELIEMDAGSLPDAPYQERFGSCAEVNCSGMEQQRQRGTTVAAGWHDERWSFDLGTTPLGFEVVDWVGGASVTGDWKRVGWSATLSRRPINSSLLSYAGVSDPGSGVSWGGVRANGIRLDLSRDHGGNTGFWGSAQQHLLTGKNVPDNWRTRLMGGSYYKLVNEEQRRVSVGLSSMWWHYQQDLGGYTLGQGGYYSPQRYLSLSLPLSYRQRTQDWSWALGGSISWSQAKTDDSRRYPLPGLLPDGLPDQDATVAGGSSRGMGYTVNALVEHRLTDHWRIGGRIDIQQADDYAPSHATLFLRYTFKPWRGDLDMPPLPLTPYGEFD
ncbi:TPA: cellulose biosynthesis protein BcsC [Aeromonas sobria]|nr:cellulose biosynthesis protein BcsC [Aeromonas sobria]